MTDELNLAEMYDFDENEDLVEVTLVELLKSEEELLHTERWLHDAPQWLMKCTETTLTDHELYKFKLEYYDLKYKQLTEDQRQRTKYRPPVRRGVSGRRQGYEPEQATTLPTLTTADEVIKFISRYRYFLGELEGGLVQLRTPLPKASRMPYYIPNGKERYAEEAAVLAAIDREPELMLENATYSMITVAASRVPGIFHSLDSISKDSPFYSVGDQDILDAALKIDKELRAEFLLTAGASEIREWRWREQFRRKQVAYDELTAKRDRKKSKK